VAEVDRILIVGGGIAGLSLATALTRRGLTPELVERSPAWPTVGAGIALHANAGRMLRTLGLGQAVARAAATLPGWSFLDQRGGLLCETDLADLWGEAGPCMGITRIRLQQILAGAAGSAKHRLGVAVTALAREAGRVSVGFSDGSSGGYDLVVGADGIYSTVRGLTVSPVPPEYAGLMSWRSVIPARPPGVINLMLLMGEGCFFGLVPVGDSGTYGFAGGERFDDPPPGRLERFRERFAGFGGPVPAYLAALEDDEQLHFGPIESLELDNWRDGRVVLIGDAAHATPPSMGEGGAMAWRTRWCWPSCSPPPARWRKRSRRTRPGAGRAPTGSSSRAGSPRRPGSCRPPSATPPCASGGTRCSATVTGRSSRPPDHRTRSNRAGRAGLREA
jgi:2-polyprenyl-6-methoxyphenol hydroxylase-like FAD-dependent oxidoreductase